LESAPRNSRYITPRTISCQTDTDQARRMTKVTSDWTDKKNPLLAAWAVAHRRISSNIKALQTQGGPKQPWGVRSGVFLKNHVETKTLLQGVMHTMGQQPRGSRRSLSVRAATSRTPFKPHPFYLGRPRLRNKDCSWTTTCLLQISTTAAVPPTTIHSRGSA